MLAAALASRRDAPDAIDAAILAGEPPTLKLDSYAVRAFRPFDPVAKRAEADIEANGVRFTVAKGAPQVILDLCKPDAAERKAIDALVEAGRRQGLSHARRRPRRRAGSLAVPRPPAAVRSSARRQRRDDRRDARDGGRRQDGDWRPRGDRRGDRREIRARPKDNSGGGRLRRRTPRSGRRAHRRRRRLRPRLPRAQVQDRQDPAGRRPYRRHDRRRRQRCAGA